MNTSIIAIYSTLVNKVAASRLYSKESLSYSNLDLDSSRGKGSSTYNTTP